MSVSFSNDRPIYLQIVDQIKVKIITGVYKPGDKLPSVREMAVEMQVNPNTMQRAYSYLEMEGLVYSQRTSGRYVNPDQEKVQQLKKELAKTQVRDFLKSMQQLGFGMDEIIEVLGLAEERYEDLMTKLPKFIEEEETEKRKQREICNKFKKV